jgi:hypothetical protein
MSLIGEYTYVEPVGHHIVPASWPAFLLCHERLHMWKRCKKIFDISDFLGKQKQ